MQLEQNRDETFIKKQRVNQMLLHISCVVVFCAHFIQKYEVCCITLCCDLFVVYNESTLSAGRLVVSQSE